MPAAAPQQGWSTRRKAVTTGAVGLLALGIWLGTMFDGFGLGSGLGLGQTGSSGLERGATGESESGASEPVSTDGVSTSLGNPADVRVGSAMVPAPTETLSVLVTGDGYELPKDTSADIATLAAPLSGHFEPATLDDVVARARQTTGNASHIRVLIYRHKSSTVGLHGTLVHALQDAGIPSGGVHVVTGFFD